MKAYLYLAKMKMLVFLTYRFEVFTSLGTNLIVMAANIFLWKAAYRNVESVAGVNEKQMLTYAMMSVLLSAFFSNTVEHTVQERIAQGNIAMDLFRPVNIYLAYLSEDAGIALSSLISKLIPLLAVTVVLMGPPMPAGPLAFILFLFSSVLSFAILWLISALISTVCFWTVQFGELKTIKDGVMLLLSGRIIPLWLFPEKARNLLHFLPFEYIYQTPLSIYIGALPAARTIPSLIIQLFWTVSLSLALILVWGRAKKRVLIQGG